MPALVTPFAEDGAIDEDAHRHNLSALTAQGAGGFVTAGSTGQGPYLLPGERQQLVTAAREELGSEAYLVCGVQAESMVQAKQQVSEAADGDADAALVMTPTTLIRGQEEPLTVFYGDLADAAPLPLLLYSVPATTGYQLPLEVASELADHPNIIGMKDSGAGPERVPPLGPAIAAGFLVLAGSSRAVNGFASQGAHGAITASANYAYRLVLDALVDQAAQDRLTTLAAAVERHGLAGTYAAAAAAGLRVGTMRSPLQPLNGADLDQITKLVG
jgi:dihydrodipicolinate synthase/N-acetylneuraminate lyase